MREKWNKTDNRTGGRKLLGYVAKISQISQLHTTLRGSSHRLTISYRARTLYSLNTSLCGIACVSGEVWLENECLESISGCPFKHWTCKFRAGKSMRGSWYHEIRLHRYISKYLGSHYMRERWWFFGQQYEIEKVYFVPRLKTVSKKCYFLRATTWRGNGKVPWPRFPSHGVTEQLLGDTFLSTFCSQTFCRL